MESGRAASIVAVLLAAVVVVAFSGCGDEQATGPAAPHSASPSAAVSTPPPMTFDPSELQPHGHHNLISLGHGAYQAELSHDETGTVTVEVLDAHAEAAVEVESEVARVNLANNGSPAQFALPRAEGEPGRFALTDGDLVRRLDSEPLEGQLVVTIGGKQYRGPLVHGDHEDHAH